MQFLRIKIKSILKKKAKDKEKITLKKVEELGKPIKFDDTYFTDAMIKEFGPGCNNSFKCKGGKAGRFLSKTFSRSKAYGQKNPGGMIKAMAMFEVFYGSKLWEGRKSIERYKDTIHWLSLFNGAEMVGSVIVPTDYVIEQLTKNLDYDNKRRANGENVTTNCNSVKVQFADSVPLIGELYA